MTKERRGAAVKKKKKKYSGGLSLTDSSTGQHAIVKLPAAACKVPACCRLSQIFPSARKSRLTVFDFLSSVSLREINRLQRRVCAGEGAPPFLFFFQVGDYTNGLCKCTFSNVKPRRLALWRREREARACEMTVKLGESSKTSGASLKPITFQPSSRCHPPYHRCACRRSIDPS